MNCQMGTTIKDIEKYVNQLFKLFINLKTSDNDRHIQLGYEEARYKFSENDIPRKIKKVRGKVKELYNILGLNICSTPHHDKLKEILQQVHDDPAKYIPKKQSSYPNNRTEVVSIKNYLIKLPLVNKKLIINEFCKKI